MNKIISFQNKFSIPLTTVNTHEVFDNIIDNQNPDYLDAGLIRNVYLPAHFDDELPQKTFGYEYSREEYYVLIKQILCYKPVMVSLPLGKPEVMEKYRKLGVNEFLVPQWIDPYANLKKKYTELKIYLNILEEACLEEIDKQFDAAMVPYKRLLDIDWLQYTSKHVPLIAIINHFDNSENSTKSLPVEQTKTSHTARGSYFLPKQVVRNINPYISMFKILDRKEFCFNYEKFINYYIGIEMLHRGNVGTDLHALRKFYKGALIHKLYPHSNLPQGNCQFTCDSCDKKCY